MAYLSKKQVGFTNKPLSNDYYKELPQKLSGNITPSHWYQEFTTNKGTPDLALISVLSEVIYWHRPKRVKDPATGNIIYVAKFLGDAWQTSYEHFQHKLGFNREKIRRIFVKLEQMGICLREFRNVTLRGQTYNNRLFIHLNSSFLHSCIGHITIENQNITNKPSFFVEKKEGGSPRFRGDYIIDKENKNIKDRSMKSNFLENSFEKEKTSQLPTNSICNKTEENRVITTNQIKNTFAKALELKDFYPLTEEDCQKLQTNSGRGFSLHAMNEILFDMSKRLTNRFFKNKKGFINYMSKVLCYEMRDAVKISNENFKIRKSQSKEEKEAKLEEEYLAEIEYSLEVSPEWHFKKRLVSVLTRKTAYNLLKAYKGADIKEGIFYLNLSRYVELTDAEKTIILSQAKSTHEQFSAKEDSQRLILELKVIMPEKDNAIEHLNQNEAENLTTKPINLPTGIWGRVRQNLIAAYGEATDRNWFSKLEVEEDKNKSELKLKAPNKFIKDWIESNYFDVIEKVIKSKRYKVVFC